MAQSIEIYCPRCGAALVKSPYKDRIGFVCPEGHGIAVTLGAVRALCGSRELVNLLWCKSGAEEAEEGAECPVCGKPMRKVALDVKGREIELDICRRCQEVWFDPNELETLPPPPDPEELPQAAREAIALERAKNVRFDNGDRFRFCGKDGQKELAETLFGDDHMPTYDWGDIDNPLERLAAAVGLPVEDDAPPLRRLPLVTWALMLLCTGVFILTFRDLGTYVREWGFIPAELARKGGATWVTSMFMHGSIWHLVGNMYFLRIFGDNVEDELGKLRYLGFILLSGFSATLLYLLLKPGSMIPCVGTSGFISGVIAMYAVLYPEVRILMRLPVRHFHVHGLFGVPACVTFLLWLIFQTVMTLVDTKVSVGGGTAYAAHLGGAITGLVCGVMMHIVRARRAEKFGR